MPQLQTWLQSSQDPEQVSTTVKGVILGASSITVFLVAQVFHITLTADSLTTLATQVGAVAGAVVFFYGLLMKGTIKVGSIKQ